MSKSIIVEGIEMLGSYLAGAAREFGAVLVLNVSGPRYIAEREDGTQLRMIADEGDGSTEEDGDQAAFDAAWDAESGSANTATITDVALEFARSLGAEFGAQVASSPADRQTVRPLREHDSIPDADYQELAERCGDDATLLRAAEREYRCALNAALTESSTEDADSLTETDYAAALRILPTLRPTSPDDGCEGMVGPLGERDQAGTVAALVAAGYEVADAADADGVVWIWVIVPEIDGQSGETEDEEEEEDADSLIQPEPRCESGHEHDWHAAHSVVGGIEENPGVWGHGGGATITRHCAHCGAYQITDTWAQDPATGEQGLTSIEYRVANEASLQYVRSLHAE